MAKIAGQNFAVYADGVKIGDARDCTLNVSQTLIDATSKDDANWLARLTSQREWSVDVTVVFDEANAFDVVDLNDLILNATQVVIEFSQGENGANGSTYWYGNAYLASCNISAPMADVTTASATFTGDGALTKASISAS